MDYPKMLYQGYQTDYQYITADDSEQEDILRAEGWKDYGDLPDYQVKSEFTDGLVGGVSESVAEQNKALQKELEAAQSEIERLNAVIAAGMEENKELRNQLRFKELEDTPADELKAMLDTAGVKYKANDSKPVLAQAVLDLENNQAD